MVRKRQRIYIDSQSEADEEDAEEEEEEASEQATRQRPNKRRSYTREQKIMAIQQVLYSRTTSTQGGAENSSPSMYELAKQLGIDRCLLTRWIRQKDSILNQKAGTRKHFDSSTSRGQEPEMEAELYQRFRQRRQKGLKVTSKWFRTNAKAVFQKLYPERVEVIEGKRVFHGFQFSAGWLEGFRRRRDITLRHAAKIAYTQKDPKQLREKITSFLRFIRRHCMLNFDEVEKEGYVGRIALSDIASMYQTPLAFECPAAGTFESIVAKTTKTKIARGAWGKRQATLQVVVFADGESRVKPLLIFPGDGDRRSTAARFQREREQYDPRVKVIFNKKAYADQTTTIDWIDTQWKMSKWQTRYTSVR